MADFPVSGKPIPEIDLRQITVSEWRAMFDPTQSDHAGDETLAKACGMSVKDIRKMPLYDYRALFQAVLEKASKPLDNDPKN
jgi:hypothetical protein